VEPQACDQAAGFPKTERTGDTDGRGGKKDGRGEKARRKAPAMVKPSLCRRVVIPTTTGWDSEEQESRKAGRLGGA